MAAEFSVKLKSRSVYKRIFTLCSGERYLHLWCDDHVISCHCCVSYCIKLNDNVLDLPTNATCMTLPHSAPHVTFKLTGIQTEKQPYVRPAQGAALVGMFLFKVPVRREIQYGKSSQSNRFMRSYVTLYYSKGWVRFNFFAGRPCDGTPTVLMDWFHWNEWED